MLLNFLKQMKDYYYDLYKKNVFKDRKNAIIEYKPVVNIDIKMFIRNLKHILNSSSQFNFIIDIQNPICIESQIAINELITSNNNDDISIKIICDKDDWQTNSNLNGRIIQYINNYRIVELGEDVKALSVTHKK